MQAQTLIPQIIARRAIRRATHPADFRPHLSYDDLRVLNKDQQIVPLVLNRAQRHLLDHLTGRDLVVKARQLGISTGIQAKFFIDATHTTARQATMAHDDPGTTMLREMQRTFYDELPEALQPPRSTNNTTFTRYTDTKSVVFSSTAGGTGAKGRAGSYSHFHGSEVAYWLRAAKLMAGVMQAIPMGQGLIVLESTGNGQQGWFYERVLAALDGDPTFALHFYPWWWADEYRLTPDGPLTLTDEEAALIEAHGLDMAQIAWRRAKQRELGAAFQQEYPEDVLSAFIASGAGYFTLRESMFTAPRDAVYLAGHRYVGGLDFGQANDYTVLSILDATTRQQVAILRINRLPWSEMRRQVIALCMAWGVSVLVAEANSMGSTNIEELVHEMDAAKCETRILAFDTTHASKTTAAAEYRLALEEGGLTLLQPASGMGDGELRDAAAVQRHELGAFTSKQTPTGVWQLSAPDGEHDDTVIAGILAWHGAGAGPLILFEIG
ncbi:MAG: hypothetical protein IT320_20805 [Anaerolineae bacterium]|nr:hypothetical protein [Anaerolineae bacterium]